MVNSRCYVKKIIPLCTFLKFHTRGKEISKIISKCFRQVFKGLKVIPQLKKPQISDETWYAVVTGQEMFKNVIKRGGHRACFHATILTNMVIFVTFGYLSAQQISSIFFSMQRFISHSLTFFDCLFIYVPEKCLQIPCIFWTCTFRPVMSPPVEFISFAKKVAIDFC